MCATGKFFEHVAGVVGGAGLAEDAAFESDHGVGGEDDGGAGGAGGDQLSLLASARAGRSCRRFAGEGSFVDGQGDDGEGEAGVVEQALGGGGDV